MAAAIVVVDARSDVFDLGTLVVPSVRGGLGSHFLNTCIRRAINKIDVEAALSSVQGAGA